MHRGSIRAPRATVWHSALAALAALAAGCQLVLDFSPIGDAGPDDIDSGANTALCTAGEPNDDLAAASAIVLSEPLDAALCGAADQDFHRFSVDGAEDVVIELTFSGAAGDLELSLWDAASATVLTISTGTDDDERIEQSAALNNRLPAGEYAALVVGRDDTVENTYQLTVTAQAAQ